MKILSKLLFGTFLLLIISCSSQKVNPELKVVQSVDLQKYAGKWYEIARLPNKFEKNLECVSATYTILENGKIGVLNQGHLISDHSKIESAKGKAKVPNKNEPGKLKVSFFWPFYGDYWILDLDPNYQYVLVGNPSREYLWVLCRTKTIDEKVYQNLMETAKNDGFAVDKVEKINQSCEN